MQAPSVVRHLCWPHPESGHLLAGGTEAGSVVIWEAPRPGGGGGERGRPRGTVGDGDQEMAEDEDGEQREWRQMAEVKCSKHAVRCGGAHGIASRPDVVI